MPQSSSTKRRAGTETERMRLAWSSRWTEGRGRESVEEDDMERGKGGEAEGEVNKRGAPEEESGDEEDTDEGAEATE